jgi:hypothetical protein
MLNIEDITKYIPSFSLDLDDVFLLNNHYLNNDVTP